MRSGFPYNFALAMFPASGPYNSMNNYNVPYWETMRKNEIMPSSSFAFDSYGTGSPSLRDTTPDASWSSPRFQSPGVAVAANWSPQTQFWVYLDPNGVVQGPFPATAMQAWYEQQYLYSELLLRPEEETEFRPLHVYLAEVGNITKPFLVPPRRFARQRTSVSKPASAVGSPLVSASNSPRPAPTAVQAEPDSVLSAPNQQGSAASNVSPDDIATTMRVMTQLQSALEVAATDDQTAQIIQSVLTSSLPHANAAGLQAILAAMQAQAAADAVSASQAQERLDTHTAPSTAASDTPNVAPKVSSLPPSDATASSVPPVATDSAPPSNEQGSTSTRGAAVPSLEQAQSTGTKKNSSKDRKVVEKTPRNDEAPAMPAPELAVSALEAEAPQKTAEAHSSLPAPETKAPAAKPKPAPWANVPAQNSASSAPSMRDILEAEQRERSAQDVKIRAANSAALAKAMAEMQVSSAPAAASRPAGAAWSMPKATPTKSLSQIQAEESARAAKEKASQATRPSAYSSSAARAPAETGWVKVVSHGKSAPASKSAPAAKPSSAPAAKPAAAPAAVPSRPPALSSVPFSSYVAPPVSAPAPAPVEQDEDGWVTKKSKHQVRRDALSQMNDAIPRPTGSAAGVTPRRVSGPSTSPLPPSAEFLQYCRTQLKGLRANVDDFIEMLLSFPLNPSPDVNDIIAEAVYANSSTLNGRQFAADFVARRKADAYRAVTL